MYMMYEEAKQSLPGVTANNCKFLLIKRNVFIELSLHVVKC